MISRGFHTLLAGSLQANLGNPKTLNTQLKPRSPQRGPPNPFVIAVATNSTARDDNLGHALELSRFSARSFLGLGSRVYGLRALGSAPACCHCPTLSLQYSEHVYGMHGIQQARERAWWRCTACQTAVALVPNL